MEQPQERKHEIICLGMAKGFKGIAERLSADRPPVGAGLVPARRGGPCVRPMLNNAGEMLERICIETFNNFENAAIDKYIVMPNHFHGIIVPKGGHKARPYDWRYYIRIQIVVIGTEAFKEYEGIECRSTKMANGRHKYLICKKTMVVGAISTA